MSHKPDTNATGVDMTAVGTAGQTVATTKYSVGTAVQNKYGDRYVKIEAKSDQAYTLYVLESDSSISSTANGGASAGRLLYSVTGCTAATGATSPDGNVHYVQISKSKFVLPMLYQSSGSTATVTVKAGTFNL